MRGISTRRKFLQAGVIAAVSILELRSSPRPAGFLQEESPDFSASSQRCHDFILACAQQDGGYRPSPDTGYGGRSDTASSDLAAVTYAATLARTMDWDLPRKDRSAEFVQNHQRKDGVFVNQASKFDPEDPLAILYNTTQGAVALRALGERPAYDPIPVIASYFEKERFEDLPLYTTSFFPLFYAALDEPFPEAYKERITQYMLRLQEPDGYLRDHVASTFHMAHCYRLFGEDTPLAEAMIERTLRDQKPDGGWDIKHPDWDVHACFDAVFILRQLGGSRPECVRAIDRGARWALSCQNADGGFGHYPGWHSDMDAVYFQFGTLIQAEKILGARYDLPDAHTLSWGHAMMPGRIYEL